DRLLLVTDQRLPLKRGAKGEERLHDLRTRYGGRFRLIELSFDQYTDLDALEAVVGMARSHDLEIDLSHGRVRRVEEAEVIDAHHRHNRYAAHPLLGDLLGEPATPRGTVQPPDETKRGEPDLDEQDVRQVIMARLALKVGMTTHELAVSYVDHLKATRKLLLDVAACKPRLKEIARRMHQDGLVNAAPLGDELFLLTKRK